MKEGSIQSWAIDCQPALAAVKEIVMKEGYIQSLSTLWGQESSKTGASLDLRADNALFFKYFGNLPPLPHIGTFVELDSS